MADEALRALERRWRGTDDPAEDEVVRLLVARLRAGRLDRARLEIAATIGHGAALNALDAWPPTVPAAYERWRASLDEAARAPLLRVPFLSLLELAHRLETHREELDLVQAWLDDPACPRARAAAGELEGFEHVSYDAPPSRRQLLAELDDRLYHLRGSILCPLEEACMLPTALHDLPRLYPGVERGYLPALADEVQAARDAILGWALA